MGRTFSLATLLLVTAIAAVSVASIRAMFVRVWSGQPHELVIPMFGGALAGGVFGIAILIWQGEARSLRAPRTWPRVAGATLGGCLLGAAAGAQATAAVDWWVIALMPLVVIGGAALVVANRRRRALGSASPAAMPRVQIETPGSAASCNDPQSRPGARGLDDAAFAEERL